MAKNQVKLNARPIKLWLAPKPFIVFKFNGVNDALFTLIISKKMMCCLHQHIVHIVRNVLSKCEKLTFGSFSFT
jgi:hypothetical protein